MLKNNKIGRIMLLPGDGIGPEIVEQAVRLLDKLAERFDFDVDYSYGLIGGASIDATGQPLTDETIVDCQTASAVLLGAVGGPKWDSLVSDKRPEKGLLAIRKKLELYANLRPIKVESCLATASPLKTSIIERGVDVLIVRELLGGIYFGQRKTWMDNGDKIAYDIEQYASSEIKRIADLAFRLARQRRRKLTLVDKANVLDSSKLWREVVTEQQLAYPDCQLEMMYVDNAAMQLIKRPETFDVMLTNNLFGDILSDEASQISGSIGMMPSASLSLTGPHLYEPIHGSAPDIAGRNLANPIGMILSVAMMLEHSFQRYHEALAVRQAVSQVLKDGYRTADSQSMDGQQEKVVSCQQMGQQIIDRL